MSPWLHNWYTRLELEPINVIGDANSAGGFESTQFCSAGLG